MGMFDYVDTGGPVKCPACGGDVRGFQTKDGDRLMMELHWFDISVFYAMCPTCREWIEFTRGAGTCDRFKGYGMAHESLERP